MNNYIVLGVVLGIALTVAVGFAANAAFAQGPTTAPVTLAQMQVMHEAMHGAGTWSAMVQTMTQAFGADWFNQMHGPNSMMSRGGMMGWR